MKFKIDLNPYPGAPYFTVQEHIHTFLTETCLTKENIIKAEKHLRTLFKISSEFGFFVISLHQKEAFLDEFKSILIKDDPSQGSDALASVRVIDSEKKILDLSFSFPQLSEKISDYSTILIDPNASLGIPSKFFLVFSKSYSELPDRFLQPTPGVDFDQDMFIMEKVLDDYVQKGMPQLLREANYKAAVLNQLMENSKHLKPATEKANRSKTIFVAECSPFLLEQLTKMGYDVKSRIKDDRIEIALANYPTHSKELIEMFSDRISIL